MPALLAVLIPALLQAGIQIAPLVAGLISFRSNLQQPDRADVSDADFAALEQVIRDLQAKIDAA